MHNLIIFNPNALEHQNHVRVNDLTSYRGSTVLTYLCQKKFGLFNFWEQN